MSNTIMELVGKLAGISNGYGMNAATLGEVIDAEAALQAEVSRMEQELAATKANLTAATAWLPRLEAMAVENDALKRLVDFDQVQVNQELRAKLAALEVQEPIAKVERNASGQIRIVWKNEKDLSHYAGENIYLAAGAKSKPMTGTEIAKLAPDDGMCVSFEDIVRAAEAHHRIGKL